MIAQTAWEVLGVETTATEKEIKRAYRQKVKLAHPDAGGQSKDFMALTNAKITALSLIQFAPSRFMGVNEMPSAAANAVMRSHGYERYQR
jgi:curved DNA-binding protein CbpA